MDEKTSGPNRSGGGIFSSKVRYNLSLYILVPLIFAGMSILTGILAFQFSKFSTRGGAVTAGGDIAVWLIVIAVAAFLCGLLITWLILQPMRRFVEEAEKLPILDKSFRDKGTRNVSEIDRFNLIFKEVTNLLSKVEARELFPDIVGQSEIMRGLFGQIIKVAATDANVLILGESGTGKELVATGIYTHSLRNKKPFVKISCVAIPEGLLESELFGHEKGAFTGAASQKIGKFEMADGGTILLDEIGDMPMETQAKLLRALQEKEFERVGGSETIKVDVRFIAASNKDLHTMVEAGRFRDDLYYRINAFTLALPPLRERKGDIPLLIDHFMKSAPQPARISPKAMDFFIDYAWPGNVRELKNTVERAALMAEDGMIELFDIPEHVLRVSGQGGRIETENPLNGEIGGETGGDDDETLSIDDRLQRIEKGMIVDALASTGGVQARAAELLGIKERSLWHRVKKYGIDLSMLKGRRG